MIYYVHLRYFDWHYLLYASEWTSYRADMRLNPYTGRSSTPRIVIIERYPSFKEYDDWIATQISWIYSISAFLLINFVEPVWSLMIVNTLKDTVCHLTWCANLDISFYNELKEFVIELRSTDSENAMACHNIILKFQLLVEKSKIVYNNNISPDLNCLEFTPLHRWDTFHIDDLPTLYKHYWVNFLKEYFKGKLE